MRSSTRLVVSLAFAAAGLSTARAADVGVSINLPGVYGRVDLGGVPQPQVIYDQPVVVDRGPSFVQEPLYVHVPPGRERNWRRYCRTYDACNRPVYFVRDDWYRNVYTPRYREAHARDDQRGPGRGPGFDARGDERHDDRHDERGEDHRDERGPGDRGRDDRAHDDRAHDDQGRDGGDRGRDDRGNRN